MKVVVDGTAAGNNSIGVCVEGWLRGWQKVPGATADVLHVVVTERFATSANLGSMPHVVVHPISDGIRQRARGQHMLIPAIAREHRPDVMLGAVPQVPLRLGDLPVVVVSHDLRHELRPAEFSRRRRALRAVEYERAYRRASRIATVSDRTRDDLSRLHPRWASKTATIHLGSDRPTTPPAPMPDRPIAVAYAHHGNKRPQLVMRAWTVAASRGESLPPLAIVGAHPRLVTELESLRARLGLSPRQVGIHSFLDDPEYTALLSRAQLVVLASTFEGFGLPVIEALRMGVPVVITPDPAMIEVGGRAVTVAHDDSPEALASAVVTAIERDCPATRRAGIEWAEQFTWAASATALRAQLVAAASSGRA